MKSSVIKNKPLHMVFLLLVLLFFIDLPFASAFDLSGFSNVRAEEITSNSAVIRWDTNESGDSFVSYGSEKASLQTLGDANPVTSHELLLESLSEDTNYYYKVFTNDLENNNSDALYSFTTLPPDTQAPIITAEVPELVAGSTLTITGKTEAGAKIKLWVNGIPSGGTTATVPTAPVIASPTNGTEDINASEVSEAAFELPFITLEGEKWNNLTLEASDAAGNIGVWSKEVFADTKKPVIELKNLSEIALSSSLPLSGTFSENVSYEIFINEKSVQKGSGTEFKLQLSLQEGTNLLRIVAKDAAGWEVVQETEILADTKAPTVKVEIEKGYEYFEGRAESNIHGDTEPGANAYVYVYKVMSGAYPDFKKARAKVTADKNGSFTFEEVEFVQLITDMTAEDLMPKEVPSNLLDIVATYPIEQAAQQQYSTYNIYIIVEDKSGKTAYWQGKVTVNTCYSGLDFSVNSLTEFQGPLALSPKLMDEGRQEVQAAFDIQYLGSAQSALGPQGEVYEKAYRIVSPPQLEKACTSSMQKSEDKFGLGCKVLPSHYNLLKGPEYDKIYVTWNLIPAYEWSKKEESFWNKFKKSQVVFPLKMTINYQERIGKDQWSDVKTQAVCTDLGYFVDIPIDSKDMIPDFLADEGVSSLNWTINQIHTVKPYVEEAYYYMGIGCMASTQLRMVVRWVRIFTSMVESYFSGPLQSIFGDQEQKEKACPLKQNGLYLKETLDAWAKLEGDEALKSLPNKFKEAQGNPEKLKLITLEERCPKTAAMWKAEAYLDQAYKWTCDRVLCRTVPAGWTKDKSLPEIEEVVEKQQQCAVTGRGIPLTKIEDCSEKVKVNTLLQQAYTTKSKGGDNVCWEGPDSVLYIYNTNLQKSPAERADEKYGIYRLTPVGPVLGDLAPSQDTLIVYKPKGAEGYIVGRDQDCKEICQDPRRPDYKAVGCIDEAYDGDKVSVKLNNSNQYLAGYTKDCFVKVEGAKAKMQQCVCEGKQLSDEQQENTDHSLRTAVAGEPWTYQQERVYKESDGSIGTNYPSIRYYSKRDFSSAFGADYLLDYLRGEKRKEEVKVSPHQIIGTVQTVCLSGILKHMTILESILSGLRNCLIEAKYTGLQDAGMCKTMFTQHVCGLMYKAISLLSGGSCSPNTFEDAKKDSAFGQVEAVVSAGFGAMEKAMQSSIEDLKDDYGNARLNEYFKGGSQGFAQSICLAAFGYELPLFSKEFLLEAAYAFPTQTNVLVAPAWRGISTYNPAKQSAIFNYEIGTAIVPGCKIKRWSVYLKCIGKEDLGNPGVDTTCYGKECDCLNAQMLGTEVEGQREYLLKSGFNLPSGQLFDVPLESPQRVDSSYRYDHVVVQLELDQSEKGNEGVCFDENFIGGNVAKYYYPIKDISPPGQFHCTASLVSGKYSCPEIASLFGFGETYLDEPYATCWNEREQKWMDCDTPNLFLLNDEIKVRAHLNSDGKSKCLKRTVQGLLNFPTESPARTIPENNPGPLMVPDSFGLVSESMFSGGSYMNLQTASNSNMKCPKQPSYSYSGTSSGVTNSAAGKIYTFQSFPQPDGTAKLMLPSGTIPPQGFSPDANNYLTSSAGKNTFTFSEIQGMVFHLDGFVIEKVLGDLSNEDGNALCAYQSSTGMSSSAGNEREFTITYELLEKDEGGSCAFAKIPVKSSAGKNKYPVRIKIQKSESGGLQQWFKAGSYDIVHQLAQETINKGEPDLEDAKAIYYDVAAMIMKGTLQGSLDYYSPSISGMLEVFFQRTYPAEVTNTGEYQKVKKYLCEVDATPTFLGTHAAQCA